MMKRLSLLLVVMFMLGLMVPSFAETITIGTGDQTARYPMDFFWKTSLYQSLYYPDELGFTSGTITALEFYNNFPNALTGKPTKIWLGTTSQPNLSTGFIPANQLTLVFDGMVDYPEGENNISITLQTSYTHTPGNLVLLVQRPMDTEYFSSSSYFKCQTIGTDRARYHRADSGEVDPNSPPGGTATGQFPMIKITYTPVTIVNDLGAISISGNTTPTAGTSYNYTIGVKNNGSATQSTYQVKLMSGTTELASVAGPTLTSLETAEVIIPWTPTTAGAMSIYGKVVLAGDEFEVNNETAPLELSVQPEGTSAVTIGAGNELARIPMDFYYKNSLYQCLYYPDELGILSGTINSIAFYNQFSSNSPTGATKIWMGNTNLLDLSAGWIPSTEMTLVFDGNVDYPAGQNTITIALQTPFNYTTGNLVMMVQRPTDTQWWSSSDHFKCQTIGSSRARNYMNDSTANDPANPTGGSLTGQFPQTTFFYTGVAIQNDLGVLSLTGNTTPSVGNAENYIVTVKNNGANTENTYQVKLMAGDVELASVNGPAIQSQQVLEIALPWTPATAGVVELYGKVIMTGDQIETNNQSLPLTVAVQAAGVVTVTVGAGGSSDRYPFDFYWKNSMFETIYQASEMNIGGVITGIQFYNTFTQDVGSKPVKVWLAETAQTELSAGFINATELDLVFDGNIVFPNGSNDIFIPIDPPWVYGGGNIVMLTNRVMDTQYYNSTNHFVTQSGPVTGRSRYLRADSTEYDPNNLTAGTVTDAFPKTTFFVVTEGMGALNGTVYGPANTPIEGATVSVANSSLVYTTGADGTYSFPYIYEGAQTISATKHGYTVDTHTVTIVEDQTTTQNFNITLLPQVTVTGRIVGSDQPTVGLADATISLSGYEPYSATTNAQGQFTIPNVFASQTYQYVAVATGYQVATGEAVVGTTDLNMGDITVNEVAFPPFNVVAVENDAATQVAVTWEAPDPNAITITEGFEDETFPPTDWSQVINDTATGGFDVPCSWARIGTVALDPPVSAPEGDWHAGMWWSYNDQDEWLITPQFACPPNAALTFDTYAFYGSTQNEHYYVKVSTDNGATWTVLWDASTLTGGWNNYNVPVSIPLTDYTGQQIKLAWHALSAPGGLYYVWFIDNVNIGNPDMTIKFNSSDLTVKSLSKTDNRSYAMNQTGAMLPTSKAKMLNPDIVEGSLNVPETRNNDRVMTGYRVWRLLQGQENNEAEWTSLTPSNITATNYTDTAWQPLPSGVYKFAVKAAYTNNVYSAPAFSNEIHKGMMGTLTGTVTDFGTNQPVEGAVITAGEYSGTSNAQGVFSFRVYAGTYDVTCFKAEYQVAVETGVVIVGTQTTTQNFVLTEIAFPPYGVEAVENDAATQVAVTWQTPDPSAIAITEGFEDETFPPTDWSQVINDTATGGFDVPCSWARIGTVALDPPVSAPEGDWHAGMWWSYNTQDEWLITPQFACPPNAALTFDTYAYYGSTQNEHYYVKVSTDNGATWTVLWDASALTGGWNHYDAPVSIPLADYTGQQIKLAWHALSAPGGLYYVWFIDNVNIGNPDVTIKFNSSDLTIRSLSKPESRSYAMNQTGTMLPTSKAKMLNPDIEEGSLNIPETRSNDRVIIGYRVWRLLQGQENNESTWTSLTSSNITATNYTDTAWQPLPSGIYKYAVKAVYTNNVFSIPAFSNEIHKGMMGTLNGTVTEFGTNLPIADAVVTAGEYSGTTNAQGQYSFRVYAGTYNVTCTKPNYQPSTQAGVVIVGTQITTQDFVLTELTNPPVGVVSEIAPDNEAVNITWQEPGAGGMGFEEGFEAETFPPTDWSQIINDTATGGFDVPCSWARIGTIGLNPPVAAPEGEWHAGMWWSYNTQDEWLITPEFNCPYDGQLSFNSYVFLGSQHNEHYYVKVSTDDGNTWNVLWDASTIMTGDWSDYNIPFTVSLADYAGQSIKLAFHALSAPGGLYYVWFVDNVIVGSPTKTITFNIDDFATRSGVQRADAGMTRTMPTKADEGNRALIGYKVWRLMQGQETNESSWTSLTPEPINATAYQDFDWTTIPDGTYKWAVKAIYTGGATSPAALSNPQIRISQIGTVAGLVLNLENAAVAGATITCAGVTATSNSIGAYVMQVPAGTYTVTASHPNYIPSVKEVTVVHQQTSTVNFVLSPVVEIFADGFEGHDDFSINFAPWTLVDVDQSTTYGFQDGQGNPIQFPHTGEAQAFIIFNGSATVPPMNVPAHGGDKFAACIAATQPPNNDWMITPQLENATAIEFWAAAISGGYTEKFNVAVSTTGTDPADFTVISGTTPVVPTTNWTKYTYDLGSYIGTPIYVGIQCVSNNAFMFMVDDVRVTGGTDEDDPVIPVFTTTLNNNYPNPFNPETTISYSLSESQNVKIEIYNVRGQLVRTLVNENKAAGNHKVVWTGVDNNNRSVSSGIYYYKMTAGKYSSSKKMVLMK
jgi:hypothetical protein